MVAHTRSRWEGSAMSVMVQYLEDGPGVAEISPSRAAARLRAGCERLPITHVLVGWNLPDAVVRACREEAARAGAAFYRWHPLLTGVGAPLAQPGWQTVGLSGERVPGFRGMPEFTFLCPNRPAVRQVVLTQLGEVCRSGHYEGMFLDRIRYPSPAADPERFLACFCNDCRRAAAAEGLDLDDVRARLRSTLTKPEALGAFVQVLLDPSGSTLADPDLVALQQFAVFRAQSVTRFIRDAADLVHAEGLEVGLDCFSPSLTWAVGQDLRALDASGEWIKVMSYGHTLGPAGLPFELLGLTEWMIAGGWDEVEAADALARATRLPLPRSCSALRARGMSPQALSAEMQRGRAAGIRHLLAGIELVEIEGVAELHAAQISADVRAVREAGVDGLVLSWDLWHTPLERLDLVREQLVN